MTLTDAELHERCRSADAADDVTATNELVVIQAVEDKTVWSTRARATLASLPCIVVSEQRPDRTTAHVDAAAEPGVVDLNGIMSAIEANPDAALALVLLQRGAAGRTVADGLIAESATYSMLQAGPEFTSWCTRRSRRPVGNPMRPPGQPIGVSRDSERLTITLDRPKVRNALNTAMRDALLDALLIAVADPTVEIVDVRGAGPDFCSGGDLEQFGTAPDPVTAHRIRLSASLARVLDVLTSRVEVHVHGACRGSGVELAAFADTVIAHPDTTFALPEVAMGLIPGAGGTVSVTRRVGRLRATTLAMSGAVIDAATAREWGLVDALKR